MGPQPGEEFGRYRLVRELGRGGFGVVFEARQLDLDRRVALKILSGQFEHDEAFKERFRREAAMLAHLESPYVVDLYDQGEYDGRLFIAMQFIDGRDLHAMVRGDHLPQTSDVVEVVAQVSQGLADAHDAGLIHRDIKPSNILVRRYGDGWFPYLCDFGIAREAGDARPHTTTTIGTFGYMAPERHQGAPASVQSDIYALGCVLWFALTGEPPYSGATEIEVAIAHMQQPVRTLPAGGATVTALNQILSKSLAKDPADRYDNARQLRADLLDAVADAQHSNPPLPRAVGVASPESSDQVDPETFAWASTPPRSSEVEGSDDSSAPSGGRTSTRWWWLIAALVVAGVIGGGAAIAGGMGLLGGGSSGSSGDSDGAASAGSDGSVTCWDGTSANGADACSEPTGRLGIQSVFAPFDDECITIPRPSVAQKAEVFECDQGRYVIRYTRWYDAADRIGYYDEANTNAARSLWMIDGKPHGYQWSSFEPNAKRKWQWSATYSNLPYAISVDADTEADRVAGIKAIDARLPEEVGLLR